ncbi:hypothetical protein [Erysipelothrix anatis]|uniref:hypothetical protein n=1 Tax=Erysipelothrix anatis TaxID=2683713 RepID=UPI0013599B62|nr:hypothetical protein [Erysipelothrix anatis]
MRYYTVQYAHKQRRNFIKIKVISIYDLFKDYRGGSFESELIDFGEDVGNEIIDFGSDTNNEITKDQVDKKKDC